MKTRIAPNIMVRPNKKISVFRVTGLKILMHIFFLIIFFSGKKIILCILKGELPFKMHKIIFFPENLKKFWVSPVNLGRYPKHSYFFPQCKRPVWAGPGSVVRYGPG